ncbi:uncharacterized protein LOC107271506 [Cephus cinctus]|uniref:Uncharacterized protein LOC107271506 n=1 Tax=Cephus cinctus TaxID=211228 RepID=A0AAJ7C6P0_CEPCN|nr:uncharacterized protein LOC107271506 [Cephus cinctus]
MPGNASATGLIAARVRPVYRPKPKRIELSGSARPAPFTLRPFAGLFNPYPYGCSVLCNHPADCEAKEVVRRAKDTWATEGKALLLPAEMEMIRATLLAGAGGVDAAGTGGPGNVAGGTEATAVPEELFRKYTETDSRPLTPAPTLASGPALTCRPTPETPATCNPRERTTLVLDLRTNSQDQETDTLSWHALTLEPAPATRKNEISVSKPTPHHQSSSAMSPVSPDRLLPHVEVSDTTSIKNSPAERDSASDEPPMRRRGKRLRKRKCRRGSTYGQQTEVRDPPEPLETQVSQIGGGSRRDSARPSLGDVGGAESPPQKITSSLDQNLPSSFIDSDILRHLSRELDREAVESEFSIKRKIALEEALRMKGDPHPGTRGSRQSSAQPPSQSVPRVFSRQSARFEVLDSLSLSGLSPLEYLGKHVFMTAGRKLIFGRAFNRYYEETLEGVRYIQPKDVWSAMEEVTGKPLTPEQEVRFKDLIGEIEKPMNFRLWCGVCAVVERLLCPLPPVDVDPPTWIERADFEGLERRLCSGGIDQKLASLLREIRDR